MFNSLDQNAPQYTQSSEVRLGFMPSLWTCTIYACRSFCWSPILCLCLAIPLNLCFYVQMFERQASSYIHIHILWCFGIGKSLALCFPFSPSTHPPPVVVCDIQRMYHKSLSGHDVPWSGVVLSHVVKSYVDSSFSSTSNCFKFKHPLTYFPFHELKVTLPLDECSLFREN